MRLNLRPRYFVALLWHWSIPFVLGAVAAYVFITWQFVEFAPLLDESLAKAFREHCK
jgi:hypothetical protein